MKKIINYIGLIALCIATTFTFINPSSINAANNITNQEAVYTQNNPIERDNFTAFLFESYDFNMIDSINISSSLSFTNVNTNITKNTQQILNTCSWGNLTASSSNYLMTANVTMLYDDDSGDYYLMGNNFSSINLINTSTCTSQTRNTYLIEEVYYKYTFFGTETQLNNIKRFLTNGIITYSYVGNDNSQSDLLINELIAYGNIVYRNYTNLTTTNVTGTANTSSSYTCNKSLTNYSYNVYMFGEEVYYSSNSSNITLNNNICTADFISLSFSGTYSFTNLAEEKKRELWNILTQFQKENVSNIANDALLRIRFFSDDISTTITSQNIPLIINVNFNRGYFYQYNMIYENINTLSKLTSSWYFDNNYKYHDEREMNNWCSLETAVEDCAGSQSLYFNKNINNTFDYVGKEFLINEFNLNSIGFALSWSFNYLLISSYILDQFEGSIKYKNCGTWEITCHVENVFRKIIYDIPILNDIYKFLNAGIDIIDNTIDLFIDYKEIALVGSAVMLAIGLHFIKRMVL